MKNSRGFTVIELFVLIAIVGIIAAIIIPFVYTPQHPQADTGPVNVVIQLPPGQTFDRIETVEPFSWVSRARGEKEEIQNKQYHLGNTTYIFQEQ